MIGFLLGGILNQYFGWRTAFLVVGAPGLLIALWVRFAVAEPPRGWSEEKEVEDDAIPLREVVDFLASKRFLIHVGLGAGLSGLAGYGLINWAASFFIRSHQVPTAELGAWLALGVGVFGAMGTFGWGYMCDRFGRRDVRWYLWLPALAMLLAIIPIFAVLNLEDTRLALIANLFPAMFTTGYLGANLAIIHGAVKARMRATASAIFFLVLNIIGLGCGPTIVGAVSDALTPGYGQEALRYSLQLVIPLACVWAAVHFMLAAKHYQREVVMNPLGETGLAH